MYNVFNWQDRITEETKKDINRVQYLNYFMRFLCSMFTYENLPKTIEKRFLEIYLHACGSVVVGKMGEDLYCAPPSLSGEVDAYGIGKDAFGVTPIGDFKGTRGFDIVWGLNNSLGTADVDIYRDADTLAEIDVSIANNIHYARMHPIPIIHDKKTQIALDKVLADIDNGTTTTVLSDNLLKGLDENLKAFELLELTDPTMSDKIQYLFHAKDDVIRQFCTRHGQSLQGTGKMAQQTEKEIDGATSMSFIDPLDMLEQREKMVDEINTIFGTDITVKFSKAWEIEYKKFTEEVEETVDDVSRETLAEDDESEVENDE